MDDATWNSTMDSNLFPERVPKAIKFKTEDGDQYSRLLVREDAH